MILHALTALEHMAQPSITCVQVVVTVFSCLAVSVTLFRLIIQYRRSQLWWEDVWATIAMVGEMVALAAFLWLGSAAVGESPSKQSTWVIINWLADFPSTLSLWAARMSLLFSIIRMTHPASRLRMMANLTAVLFAFCWVGLTVQKQLACRLNPKLNKTICTSRGRVAITQICTDVAADSLLVALASGLLRNAQLRESPRRIIRILFSASILTTIVGIVNAIFIIGTAFVLAVITSYVQPAVSLLVCNLPVVVTFFYRQFKREQAKDGGGSYDYATSSSSPESTDASSNASPDRTRDASGIIQSGPIYSADLTPTILTQPSDIFQHSSTSRSQKSPPFEIA